MNNNKLALIVSYYLARFDREGLEKIGFSSFNQAFEETARRLDVKKNYVKLRRDEFDPVFPWREGWKRPMDRQIVKTIEAFQDIGETDLREIVLNILNNHAYGKSEEAEIIIDLINEERKSIKKKRNSVFILRGPTGKKAEDFFIQYHKRYNLPIKGELKDMRDFGCGYDFEINSENQSYFVEVKGLVEISGGILFTNKEWETALKAGNSYYLVIVKNIKDTPEISFITNPAGTLKAQKRIYTVLQVQWSVKESELSKSI